MKDKITASAQVVLENLDQEIKEREMEISQLTATRASLRELYGIDSPAPAAPEPECAPKAGKRPYKKRAAKTERINPAPALDIRSSAKAKPGTPVRSTEAIMSNKPDTLGGAMKQIARSLKTFTQAQIVEQLEADADFAKLFEAAGESTFYGNLAYWTKTGKLTKDGDGKEATYQVVSL